MSDLYLDPKTHDLTSDIHLVTGNKRVAQQIKVTLLTFLGEWFLDTTFGVPYFEQILIKSPRRAQVEAIIRAKVKDVPGVTRVPAISVEIDNQTRRGRITMKDIDTDFGPITVRSLCKWRD